MRDGENVRINFVKIDQCDERLDEIIASLEESREKISRVCINLEEHEMLPQTSEALRKIIIRIDSQIFTAKKKKLALEKAKEIFLRGEEGISSAIESEPVVKSGFSSLTYILDHTGMEWSIK